MVVLFSIAACQILLGLALAALLLSGEKLRLPPIRLPLALFMLGTLISLALSDDPPAGSPQIRKFFVFVMLLVVYSTFHEIARIRWLLLAWMGTGALVALRGLVQFGVKRSEARTLGMNFYQYYVSERITGFMSHWMTFGGELMIVLLFLAAFVFFSPLARRRALVFALLCSLPLAAALLLGFTRSIWLAAGVSGLYLAWHWRRWVVLAAPVVLAVGLLVSPASVRSRITSSFRPHGDLDSNQHRIVCWLTGWEMIKAHPWFGVGPEHVKLQFKQYVPPDIPRPLPTGWYGHLHNIYVHYAAERGIPTMLAMLWMLLKILADFWRAARHLPRSRSEERFVLLGAAAVVIAIMVASIFELNLGDSEVLTMFLTAVAVGYAARDLAMKPEAARA